MGSSSRATCEIVLTFTPNGDLIRITGFFSRVGVTKQGHPSKFTKYFKKCRIFSENMILDRLIIDFVLVSTPSENMLKHLVSFSSHMKHFSHLSPSLGLVNTIDTIYTA